MRKLNSLIEARKYLPDLDIAGADHDIIYLESEIMPDPAFEAEENDEEPEEKEDGVKYLTLEETKKLDEMGIHYGSDYSWHTYA
jgi:hypothetical protein